MRMRASAAPVVDVTLPAAGTCRKRRQTQVARFFFLCLLASRRSALASSTTPGARPAFPLPLFPSNPGPYPRPAPLRAILAPQDSARADATPAALRRSINTRSRCRCARSASELPRTAHSVAAAGGSPPPRAPPPRAPPPPPMTTLARGRISCCSTPRSARCAGWGPAASRRIARRRFRRRPRRRRRRRPRRRRRRPSPHLRLAAARRARRAPPAAGGHLDRRRAPSRSFASVALLPGAGPRSWVPFEGADRLPTVSARRARSARRRSRGRGI